MLQVETVIASHSTGELPGLWPDAADDFGTDKFRREETNRACAMFSGCNRPANFTICAVARAGAHAICAPVLHIFYNEAGRPKPAHCDVGCYSF